MSKIQTQKIARQNRHRRIRSRVVGTANKPRLCVYRSNRAIYAQIIDDVAGRTLAAADSRKQSESPKQEQATQVGTKIATAAKKLGIETVVFDRGGFQYHGAVAAVADAARAEGLAF